MFEESTYVVVPLPILTFLVFLSALPLPVRQAVCPNVEAETLGACVISCRSDEECSGTDGQLCCSTGCGGRVCTVGDRVPYYPVPPTCPAYTTLATRTVNCSMRRSCSAGSACPDGQLCCTTECGRVCEAGQYVNQCEVVLGEIRSAGIRPPPGYYTPMCASDNHSRFNATQCTEGLCWCVNVQSGRPVSSYYPRGVFPECRCEL